jgi:predicted LPLAT superfamily acyltransferase
VSAQWHERRETSSRFTIWLLLTAGLRLGRGFMRAALYPLALLFFLRRARERRDSRAFLDRVLAQPARNRDVLRHIRSYAQTMLDRVFLLNDTNLARFDLRLHGLDQVEAEMARGHGVLLLGAHFGSFEVLRALTLHKPDMQLRVVMDLQRTHALNALMHALNPGIAANVIDAGDDPGALALALHEAASQGALIGLLADRARAGEATAAADFLGAPAYFPTAPYLIASMLDLPVVLAFGIYRGANRYDLHFEIFAQSIKIVRAARAAQLQECVVRFAARLEHYVRLYPYNWSNFYDFWHCPAEQPAARRESAAAGAR